MRGAKRRRRWWPVFVGALAGLWLTQVSRVGRGVERGNRLDPRSLLSPGGTLRVLSLNLWHDFPRFWRLRERLHLVATRVRALNVDVLCLQEVAWTPHTGNAAVYLARLTGMEYVYLRANGNRWAILFEEGVAILSRCSLGEVTWCELRPRAGPFEHRVVLGATVAMARGQVRLFVTHLTNGDSRINRAQAAALQAFVARGPAVIVGDFNAAPDSPAIRALTCRWVDAARVTGHQDEFTCCVAPRSADPLQAPYRRIDYAFLLGVEARDCRPLWIRSPGTGEVLWASNHAGVLVEVGIGAGSSGR